MGPVLLAPVITALIPFGLIEPAKLVVLLRDDALAEAQLTGVESLFLLAIVALHGGEQFAVIALDP